MNQEQMELKTPEYVSLQFQLAGVGSRAAAFLIDKVILTVVNIVIVITTILATRGMSDFPFFIDEHILPLAIMVILLFIINGCYFLAFEFFSGGRTIGKKLIGIRVIQENGQSLTLLSSFIRNLVRIIDSLPAFYLLGFILMFFHPHHKRLGDIVAGTIIIHERKAKRKSKLSAIEKEIQFREITKDDLAVDDWKLRSFTEKDWQLIQTYANRLLTLSSNERREVTIQLAEIFFPKLGIEITGKNEMELENTLLRLYLILRDEWQFEL